MRHAALLGAVAAFVSACGFLPPPAWVTDREPLESCGTEDVGQGGVGMDVGARRCLLAAYEAGEGAELVTTQPSVEGDPITRIIRVHPDGTVEILYDATKDRYGSGSWQLLRCDRLFSVAEANDPPDTVYPDDMVFVEDRCEDVTPP
jgi:hypothetical protein